MTDYPFAIWIPSEHGKWLKLFTSRDLAELFVIRYGGGLEIIANTFETF